MSNATIAASSIPTYELKVEPQVSSYYLKLFNTEHQLRIDHDEVRDCAGLPFERPMMVINHLAGDLAAGVEIISPLEVTQAEERDGHTAVEITIGRDPGGELVTVDDGISFDRSDEGRYPGVSMDYTPEGEAVALRVDRAVTVTSELL